MAVENPKFGKGIALAAGFDLGAKAALDSRSVVKSIEERDAHVTGNRAYEGMLVYVEDNGMTYRYQKNAEGQLEFVEFGFNQAAFDESLESAMAQDRATIADHESRIGAVETQIGDEDGGLVKDIADNKKAIEQEVSDRQQAVSDAKDELQGKIDGVESAANAKFELLNGTTLPNMKSELEGKIQNAQNAANAAQGDVDVLEERLDAEGGLVDRIEANEAFVAAQPAIDEAQDNAIEAAQGAADAAQAAADKAQGEVDALEILVGQYKEALDGKDAAIEADIVAHKAAQETKEKSQDDAIAAVADRATSLENRANGFDEAIERIDEKDLEQDGKIADIQAKDVTQDNRLDDIEESLAEGGDIKELIDAAQKAADDAQGEVDALEGVVEALDSAYKAADAAFEIRIAANEAFVAAQPAKDQKQTEDINKNAQAIAKEVQDRETAVNTVAGNLATEVARADAEEKKIREDFAAADTANLNAAKKYADDAITALVDSAPEAMNTLNELAEAIKGNEDIYKAYVEEHAQAMATMKSDLQAEIDADVAVEKKDRQDADAALQTAIDNEASAARAAEKKLGEDLQAAKDELAEDIQANADEMTKQKNDAIDGTLANKIKANAQAIADEAAEARKQEGLIRGEMATEAERVNAKIAADILVETNRAKGKESELAQAVADEKTQREAQDNALDGKIDTTKTNLENKIAQDIATESALRQAAEKDIADDLAAEVQERESEIARVEGECDAAMAQEVIDRNNAIKVEEDRAKGIEQGLQNAVDALEDRMDTAESDIDTLENWKNAHSHTEMQQGIADNLAAINKLNGDANTAGSVAKSIADALVSHADREEVKAMFVNVINSLDMKLEEDELVLTLGTEGLKVASVEIDVCSEQDIQDIIDGLDAAQAE